MKLKFNKSDKGPVLQRMTKAEKLYSETGTPMRWREVDTNPLDTQFEIEVVPQQAALQIEEFLGSMKIGNNNGGNDEPKPELDFQPEPKKQLPSKQLALTREGIRATILELIKSRMK